MTCEWFLLCENPAQGVVNHPFLGDVPTCQRCAEKLGLEFEPITPPEPDLMEVVAQAWRDQGRHPEFHQHMQRKLRAEWPMLARALDSLPEKA